MPYAIDRYVRETDRLYGVLTKRLADRAFVAGDDRGRPAALRAYQGGAAMNTTPTFTEESKALLFGQSAATSSSR